MTKNLKFIAPMALVAFAALASCGGTKPTDKYKINRLKLTETIEDDKVATTVPKILVGDLWTATEDTPLDQLGFYGQQFTLGETKNDYYKDWKTPEKGTIAVQYGIALSGNVNAIIKGSAPIDLNNVNIATANAVKVSWDATHGQNFYLKAEDANNKSYIVSETFKDESGKSITNYHFCYDIKGIGKFGFTDTERGTFGYEDDFVMYYLPKLLGYFTYASESYASKAYVYKGVGFDLSGFGLDTDKAAVGGIPVMINEFAPGLIFGGQTLGAIQKKKATIYDYLSLIRGALQSEHFNYEFKQQNDDTHKNALTGDIYLKNYNLADLKDALKPFIKNTTIDLEGKVSGGYFFAYEDAFLKQQELSIDLNAPKAVVLNGQGSSQTAIVASNLNLNVYLSQDVTGECVKDTVNVDEYIAK